MLKTIFLLSIILFLIVPALSQEKIEPIAIDTESVEKIQDIYRNVKSEIEVFGTDYMVDESGTIFLQLLDEGQPVLNASCILDVFFPDKTTWIQDAPMINFTDGVFYYDIVTPDLEGIYITTVYCWYTTEYKSESVDNFILTNGTDVSGSFLDTYSLDLINHFLKEDKNDSLDFIYEFYNIFLDPNTTQLDIFVQAKWNTAGEDVVISIYNYDLVQWEELSNRITLSPTFTSFNNAIFTNFQDYIQNGTVRLRFNDTANVGGRNNLRLDWVQLAFTKSVAEFINEIRGGGEIHVQNTPERVWETLFIRGTPPHMKSTSFYCKPDNITLVKNITFEFCRGPACTDYQKLEDEICLYGCDPERSICRDPAYLEFLTIIGIIIGLIIFVLAILWVLAKLGVRF